MSSDDESDSLSEVSVTNENGNVSKKQKLQDKSKMKKDNNNKKPDLMKNKEKSVPVLSTTVEQAAKAAGNSKEVKTTTVKDILRAQRDAFLKRSNPTSSAGSGTSDDSSSSDSSTSDSSSDGHSDDDLNGGNDHQTVENRTNAADVAVASAINKQTTMQQINGIAPSIDSIALDGLNDLSSSERDTIHRFVEISKMNPTEKPAEMLYEYAMHTFMNH